jgi:hypothetical protein
MDGLGGFDGGWLVGMQRILFGAAGRTSWRVRWPSWSRTRPPPSSDYVEVSWVDAVMIQPSPSCCCVFESASFAPALTMVSYRERQAEGSSLFHLGLQGQHLLPEWVPTA